MESLPQEMGKWRATAEHLATQGRSPTQKGKGLKGRPIRGADLWPLSPAASQGKRKVQIPRSLDWALHIGTDPAGTRAQLCDARCEACFMWSLLSFALLAPLAFEGTWAALASL